jgi:hypothetical protein
MLDILRSSNLFLTCFVGQLLVHFWVTEDR